jgi:hypothetical protein
MSQIPRFSDMRIALPEFTSSERTIWQFLARSRSQIWGDRRHKSLAADRLVGLNFNNRRKRQRLGSLSQGSEFGRVFGAKVSGMPLRAPIQIPLLNNFGIRPAPELACDRRPGSFDVFLNEFHRLETEPGVDNDDAPWREGTDEGPDCGKTSPAHFAIIEPIAGSQLAEKCLFDRIQLQKRDFERQGQVLGNRAFATGGDTVYEDSLPQHTETSVLMSAWQVRA